ncbi:hypothetical protein [Tautonia plasticadhaerens]|uniref:Uncharacterized protein n=1 Tax=Tautonia plasticadhaerens TaxID=2527974 RepID=A0A518HAE2_9BACT|nr:hypothetical protein [Tautonia plasticadhaerens]QDV37822.1 hypothetical protein ElP_57690 [Tautonia plasticadhaerens]
MKTPSEKQVAANRRNALRSTGPRTAAGKLRSRRNGLVHGLAAEVVVPEEDRAAFEAQLARWDHEMGPANVVERHLARRAAVCSVKLERIERAREQTHREAALKALGDWEKRGQARARRKAQDLARDPSNTVLDLEGTAFGCDWLIRRWQSLDAPLQLGQGWDQRTVLRAQALLGFPECLPGPDANREVRRLWILAAAASPTQVTALPRLEAEGSLPTEPAHARAALSRFVAEQVRRLEGLRAESWEEVEGPEGRAIALQAAAADPSGEGQLMHRYEVAADRAANATVRLFLNLRDRRRRELLELSKEARHSSIPRAPVGGGWWCEVDADPAPPGFERIGAVPTVAVTDLGIDSASDTARPDPDVPEGPGPRSPASPGPSADHAPDPAFPGPVSREETGGSTPSPAAPNRPDRVVAPALPGSEAPPTGPSGVAAPVAASRPESAGAPKRSEPNSAGESQPNSRRNRFLDSMLRKRPADPAPAPGARTGPIPPPAGRPDRPPVGPSRPGDRGRPLPGEAGR